MKMIMLCIILVIAAPAAAQDGGDAYVVIISADNSGPMAGIPEGCTPSDEARALVDALENRGWAAFLAEEAPAEPGTEPVYVTLSTHPTGHTIYHSEADPASWRLARYLLDHLNTVRQPLGYFNFGQSIESGTSHDGISIRIEANFTSDIVEVRPHEYDINGSCYAPFYAEAFDEWARAEAVLRRWESDGVHIAFKPDPAQAEAIAWSEIATGRTDSPHRMAYSFDVSTNINNWPSLRAALRERKLTATFFLTGDFIRQYPYIVREMLADGHDFGNHSDTHLDYTEMSEDAVQADLLRMQAELGKAIGAYIPMRLWRAPFGARNIDTLLAAAELGMISAFWGDDGDVQDWHYGATADSVYEKATAAFMPGQIFVAHLGSDAGVEAFPRIADEAAAQGYTLGSILEVLTDEQIALIRGE